MNEKQLAYYCPALIRQGITQVKHMFVNGAPPEEVLVKIGPTWRQVYRCGLANFLKVQPIDWSKPSVWLAAWGKSDSLARLSPNPHTETRQ